MQTIAGYGATAGWTTVCGSSYLANSTSTQDSEAVLLQNLLEATPGSCNYLFNPMSLPIFNVAYPGPWVWPFFTKSGSGSHTAAMGNGLQGGLAAEVIRKIIH